MAGKQEGKPRSFKAAEMMKPDDKDKADVGENRGLRGATGAKSFFYRNISPMTGKHSILALSPAGRSPSCIRGTAVLSC